MITPVTSSALILLITTFLPKRKNYAYLFKRTDVCIADAGFNRK